MVKSSLVAASTGIEVDDFLTIFDRTSDGLEQDCDCSDRQACAGRAATGAGKQASVHVFVPEIPQIGSMQAMAIEFETLQQSLVALRRQLIQRDVLACLQSLVPTVLQVSRDELSQSFHALSLEVEALKRVAGRQRAQQVRLRE